MTNLEYWFSFEFTSFLWLFIALNIANVIIQTYKSIVTIKGTKAWAAFINAITYGLYTIVVVFMSAEGLGLAWKALIIGLANLGGVYVVKLLEEKSRKDKLWKVEATVMPSEVANVSLALDKEGISYNCFKTSGEHRVFNIFCPTQKESLIVKNILDQNKAKYFVSESKTL